MTLIPITAVIPRAPRAPWRSPLYVIELACGHVLRRRFEYGRIPKQRARCPRCRTCYR
jgi:hypothetical protein